MNSYLKHKEFSKGIANALVILLFLYGILSLGVGIRNALLPRQSQDLAPVYRAAHSWIAGHDPYEIQRPAPGELPAGAPAAFSTPYAFTAILDTALVAWLPWQRARIAWIALNLVLLVAGFILVLQAAGSEFSPLEGVALLALLWSGEGVRVCLGNGQHSIVVFFSVALMTWAMQSRRDAIAGGALALSLHKFSWTPFMAIVPFAKGRQRVLVFAFLTACMELAIFVARIGVGTARQALASYRKEILWWTSHTQKAEFDRFGFSQLSAVWFDVLPREAATIVHWTIVAVGIVTAILVLHRRQGMSLVAVSLVCLLCLVSVYHGIYDSICLYFPIVATFVVVRKTRERTPTLFFGLLSLVWLIDPSKLSSLLGGRLLPLLARCLDDGLRIFLLVVMLGFMHSIWRSTAFADDPV